MPQIAISSLVLCVALFLIARKEAEISLPVIIMICVGVSIITLMLSLVIGPFAFLVSLVLVAFAIQRFCYVSWPKAAAVSGIYAVANIALAVGQQMLRTA